MTSPLEQCRDALQIIKLNAGSPERVYELCKAALAAADAEPEAIVPLHRAAPVAAQGWQPIETAPKDGTRVIVWIDDTHVKGCAFAKPWFYSTDGRFGGGAEGYNGDWNITHWMPLPAAPKEPA